MTMQSPWGWDSLLEEEPRAAYSYYLDQADLSTLERQTFDNEFDSFFNQFLGLLAADAKAGLAPNRRFQDFLAGVDFEEEAAGNLGLTAGRIGRQSQLAPSSVRYIP